MNNKCQEKLYAYRGIIGDWEKKITEGESWRTFKIELTQN